MNIDWDTFWLILDYVKSILLSEPVCVAFGAWLSYLFSTKTQAASDKMLLKVKEELDKTQSKSEKMSNQMKEIEMRCTIAEMEIDQIEKHIKIAKGGNSNDS